MDKILQAAKAIWPQVSENTRVMYVDRDSVLIWTDGVDRPFSGRLPVPDAETDLIVLANYLDDNDNLIACMGYSDEADVLAVKRKPQTIQERLAYHWRRIKQLGGDWAPLGAEMALWINDKREWGKA